jgi:hypothetical protein
VMFAVARKEAFRPPVAMSALPPKADMCSALAYVCFGPKADSCEAAKKFRYSITSSARNNIDGGTVSPRALAVLTFTAISNFTGTWTGRSAGLAPRNI